jgi:hypothetical protein
MGCASPGAAPWVAFGALSSPSIFLIARCLAPGVRSLSGASSKPLRDPKLFALAGNSAEPRFPVAIPVSHSLKFLGTHAENPKIIYEDSR